jgi:hypothetical protein
MSLEKPVLMLDEIIYPKKLYNILNDYLKNKSSLCFGFGRDCVRLIVLMDTNKDRLDNITREIRDGYVTSMNQIRVILFNEEDVIEQIKGILRQIENGIPEKTFYDWFITLAFQMSQNNLPMEQYSLKIKEGYLPVLKIQHYENINKDTGNNINYLNYLWLSSNGSLANEVTLTELTKKADKLIKEKIDNQFKPKKVSKYKRTPLDSKLRHEVFKRDGYKCKECGATKEEKTLHCDHIISVAQGGNDEMDNLQTLCDDCNLAKSDKCWKSKNGDDDGK